MKKITDISHMILEDYIKKDCIAVDFTIGTGADTCFFANHDDVHQVIGFDIQAAAIEQAKLKLGDENVTKVCLYQVGHEYCKQYIEHYHVGVFNFGYLPGADCSITTLLETSKQAVEKALDCLDVHGGLVLVIYPGHAEGSKEAMYFDDYCEHLDAHYYACMKIRIENRKSAPYIWLIEKLRTA